MSRAMRILKNVSEGIFAPGGVLQLPLLHPLKQGVLVVIGQLTEAIPERALRLFIERVYSAPPRFGLARHPRASISVLLVLMEFLVDQCGHWYRRSRCGLRHDPSGEGLNSLKLVRGKEFRFAADGEPVCYDFPGFVIPRGGQPLR